jgi:LPXTG-motif cell wall-anchored protein
MKTKIALAVLLVVGLSGYFMSAPAGVSPEQKAACEASVDKRGSDPSLAKFKQAQEKNESAQEAAQRISTANRADTGANGLQMLFLGLAIVGVFGLLISFFKKKPL